MDPNSVDGGPYVISAGDYIVLDGDTFSKLSGKIGSDGRQETAYRIRFRSIEAPEKHQKGMYDISLRKAGIDIHSGSPGMRATRQLRDFCKNRDILVMPSGRTDENVGA